MLGAVAAQVLGGCKDTPATEPPPEAESLWQWSFKRLDVTCAVLWSAN